MESSTGKESIVSRLFAFGRRKSEPQPDPEPSETGFSRTDDAGEQEGEASEQLIRMRAEAVGRKDEAIQAIGESFRELTSMLGSVSDRLDRQDSHSASMVEHFKDIPEYLQGVAGSLARLPEAQQEQARAIRAIGERLAEGTEAFHGLSEAIGRIPDEMREHVATQDAAIRKVAAAQKQMAQVLHAGHQKTLQLFHQSSQKTLQNVQKTARVQQRQMEQVVEASVANMKRMFLLAAAFVAAAIVAVVALASLG